MTLHDLEFGACIVRHGGAKFQVTTLSDDHVSAQLRESGVFYELAYLEHLAGYLAQGDIVLDIGSHIGNHTLFFSKVCGARVVAFEPNPRAFAAMNATLSDNGAGTSVSAHNIALNDGSAQTATLTTASSRDAGTYAVGAKEAGSSIQRPARALDSFREYFSDRPIRLVKMDVEGAEVDILRGGLDVLAQSRPVLGIEVMSVKTFDKVDAILSELGYHPVAIFNATPTIVWTADHSATDRNAGDHSARKSASEKRVASDVFRYAIRNAVRSNNLATQLRTEKARIRNV